MCGCNNTVVCEQATIQALVDKAYTYEAASGQSVLECAPYWYEGACNARAAQALAYENAAANLWAGDASPSEAGAC